MKESYIRAMTALHRLCVFLAASCLVIMTLIIPYGVFTRYVLGSAASWPEPMAILLMIIFSFVAAAACYRDGLHIAVMAVPDMLSPRARLAVGWIAEFGMIAANLFMLIWGFTLVELTMHQVVGEFPILSVGITYAPIPIGGAITLLFVVERLWTGNIFARPTEGSIGSTSTE